MAILRQDYIERRLHAAIQRFRETRDPLARREMEWWSVHLADLRHLAVLESAVLRCRDQDLNEDNFTVALQYLEDRAALKWPFQHFRDALKMENNGGRWYALGASLIEIRMALGMDPDT